MCTLQTRSPWTGKAPCDVMAPLQYPSHAARPGIVFARIVDFKRRKTRIGFHFFAPVGVLAFYFKVFPVRMLHIHAARQAE